MAGTVYNLSTSSIFWLQPETQVTWDSTNGVTISCVGLVVAGNTPTALDDAIQLLPTEIPISNDGPVGNSTRYSGATYSTISASYTEENIIRLEISFQLAVPLNLTNNGGFHEADSDKAVRTIAVSDEPVLSHPLVESFDENDRRKLSALLKGDVWINPGYDSSATTGSNAWEFVRYKVDGEELTNELSQVTFSTTDYTKNDVTASADDYARMIGRGITTYRRPTVKHTLAVVRNDPATNSEYGQVGEVVASPYLAPNITGDFEWFLSGITDATENGETWNRTYEYELSGAGGVLKYLYPNGSAELA